MPELLLLRSPSANRVYAGEAARLSVAELEVTAPVVADCRDSDVAGVGYLAFAVEEATDPLLEVVASQSTALALFERVGELLRPVALPHVDQFDDDLVTIPKYQGKTNEQFTRLLLNVTLAMVGRRAEGPRRVLDPMAGRGTTLSTALVAGCDAFGVEADVKAFEQMAAFYTTWLRRKRIKHTARTTPVRREGRNIGKRFDAQLQAPRGHLQLTAFTGDTRDSAELFGRQRFDAVVVDAPYGIVHGAGRAGERKRDRTPGALLAEAVPVWASQLVHGGAMGISWNSLGLAREELAGILSRAGLVVASGGAWERFGHRVDSSIRRDLMVATKP